jgi:hypothetical protein
MKIEKKDEITKLNLSQQTNLENKKKCYDSSEYAQKLGHLKELTYEGYITNDDYGRKKRKQLVAVSEISLIKLFPWLVSERQGQKWLCFFCAF